MSAGRRKAEIAAAESEQSYDGHQVSYTGKNNMPNCLVHLLSSNIRCTTHGCGSSLGLCSDRLSWPIALCSREIFAVKYLLFDSGTLRPPLVEGRYDCYNRHIVFDSTKLFIVQE